MIVLYTYVHATYPSSRRGGKQKILDHPVQIDSTYKAYCPIAVQPLALRTFLDDCTKSQGQKEVLKEVVLTLSHQNIMTTRSRNRDQRVLTPRYGHAGLVGITLWAHRPADVLRYSHTMGTPAW